MWGSGKERRGRMKRSEAENSKASKTYDGLIVGGAARSKG